MMRQTSVSHKTKTGSPLHSRIIAFSSRHDLQPSINKSWGLKEPLFGHTSSFPFVPLLQPINRRQVGDERHRKWSASGVRLISENDGCSESRRAASPGGRNLSSVTPRSLRVVFIGASGGLL
ncbi:unnamed protein product [Caenorhabditis auriculariae]|uniref:Uncharacterized protein n=1 Tax=Caenorhabditis auriculariae TaxID=2777116 RepID=A0A8S1HPR1_9PELO|nr:unnamed protein product [Caenorhabditis auriculariae]